MTTARGKTTGVDSELDRYIGLQKTTDVMTDNCILFWKEREHSWHHWQMTSSQHLLLKHTLKGLSKPVETCAA